MKFDGLDLLKEAFNKFASKYPGEDLGVRTVRSVAAGGKALLDKAQLEFPQSYIQSIAQDFYAMITGQKVADGVSAAVASLDEEKVKDLLDQAVSKLKEEGVSLQTAKLLKELLNKNSIDDIEANLEEALGDRSLSEKMVFKAFIMQARPHLEEIRDGSLEDVAAKVREMADAIPTDAIAAQVGALTSNVTPDVVSEKAQDVVSKAPSPQALSGIVHGLAKVASEKLNDISNVSSVSDAKTILGSLASEAGKVVSDALANDNVSKKGPAKKKGKGGSFDL